MTTKLLISSIALINASFLAQPALRPTPFTIRVVDEQTGAGVPDLRVTTDNGIVCYTGGNGVVSWDEYSLMSRAVHFEIQDQQNQFVSAGATLRVTRGGQAELKIHRQRATEP